VEKNVALFAGENRDIGTLDEMGASPKRKDKNEPLRGNWRRLRMPFFQLNPAPTPSRTEIRGGGSAGRENTSPHKVSAKRGEPWGGADKK